MESNLEVEFKGLLKEFHLAMSAAGIAAPAVLAAYQSRFKNWSAQASQENPSGLQAQIALANDIADQSYRHVGSLMVRVNAAVGQAGPVSNGQPAAPAAPSKGGSWVVWVILGLLFLK